MAKSISPHSGTTEKCRWCHDKPGGCMLCNAVPMTSEEMTADRAATARPPKARTPVLTHVADDTPEARAIETEFAPGVWDTSTDYGPREKGGSITSISTPNGGTTAKLPDVETEDGEEVGERRKQVLARGGKDEKLSSMTKATTDRIGTEFEYFAAERLGVLDYELTPEETAESTQTFKGKTTRPKTNRELIEMDVPDFGWDFYFHGYRVDAKCAQVHSQDSRFPSPGAFVKDVKPMTHLYYVGSGQEVGDYQFEGWARPSAVKQIKPKAWSKQPGKEDYRTRLVPFDTMQRDEQKVIDALTEKPFVRDRQS